MDRIYAINPKEIRNEIALNIWDTEPGLDGVLSSNKP
tara:strand:- start:6268 stop:6378 length:111 start_codon:yes stop_codon:yes gene_type:complete